MTNARDDALYRACINYRDVVDRAMEAMPADNSVELLDYATAEWHAEQRIRQALQQRDEEAA